MSEDWRAPLPWRSGFAAICAVLVAALTGTLIFSGVSGYFDPWGVPALALYVGLPVAGIHALIIGAPLYALAKAKWRLGWWGAAIGGALTGTLPTIGYVVANLAAVLINGDDPNLPLALGTLALLGVSGAAAGIAYRALHGPDRRPVNTV